MASGVGYVEIDLQVFDAAPAGIAVTSGPEHRLIYTNEAYRSLFGVHALGVSLRQFFQEPADIDHYLELLTRVREGGEPVTLTEFQLSRVFPSETDTHPRWFGISLSPIRAAGFEPGVLVIAAEVTAQTLDSKRIEEMAEERARLRTRYRMLGRMGLQLVWVAEPGGGIVEPSAGWEAVTGQPFEEFRGDGWLDMLHPDDRESTMADWRQAQIDVPSVWERSYRLRMADGGYRHFKVRAVPVREGGRLVEWVGTCTDVEAEVQLAFRDRLLARAVAATSGVARVEEMLDALAHIIVPTLADSCRVYVLRDTPNRPPGDLIAVEPVSSVVRNGLPDIAEKRQELRGPGTTLRMAIDERRPIFRTFPPGEPAPDVGTGPIRRWFFEAKANCAVTIPISVDGAVAAVAAVSVCGDRPAIDEDTAVLIGEVFERAHDALSRAMAFRRTQQVALAMQHALLTEPPEIPGLSVAARYQPTVVAAEVGGDWYDCFRLPDGSTVLSIGDVAGHDLPAAVTMGQVRTILRGLAVGRPESSSEVLRLLNAAVNTLYSDRTATCVLAKVQRKAGGLVFSYAVAGHPPPLYIAPDGTCRYLWGGRNPLLGLECDCAYVDAQEPLPPGSTVLLYTDGLMEQPGEDIDEGLNRLCENAGLHAAEPPDTFCDKLLAGMRPSGQDDIAMIALRVPSA